MRRMAAWLLTVLLGLVPVALARESPKKEKLSGYAEWRSGDFLIVDGQRVAASSSLRFAGGGRATRFETIPLGYEVRVNGVRLPNGVVLAEELKAAPNGSAFFETTLRAEANAMEETFRRAGRAAEYNERGFVVSDYGALRESGGEVERVRAITARLVPPYASPDEFRTYVVENKEWNAMAAPNGSIYVFSGLLEDLDDDEVAIVLGHELAHATHEHSRRHFKRALLIGALGAGVALAAEAIDNRGARIAVQSGLYLGTLAWANGYGRECEDQADRVGLRYAHQAGYDVRKGPGLWNRFAEKYRGLPRVLNFFFGNHSVARDRAANLERELRLNYSSD